MWRWRPHGDSIFHVFEKSFGDIIPDHRRSMVKCTILHWLLWLPECAASHWKLACPGWMHWLSRSGVCCPPSKSDKVWTKIILGCTAWCPNGTMTWPSKWDSWEVEMVTPIASHSCIQIFKARVKPKNTSEGLVNLARLKFLKFPRLPDDFS